MGTFDVIGHIGGISGALFKIATFLVAYYSKISFRVSLINLMYSVTYKGRSKDCQDNTLRVNFCNKLKLITNLCPNKKMKRFIKRTYLTNVIFKQLFTFSEAYSLMFFLRQISSFSSPLSSLLWLRAKLETPAFFREDLHSILLLYRLWPIAWAIVCLLTGTFRSASGFWNRNRHGPGTWTWIRELAP